MKLKNTLMITGMVVSWSVFYAVSKMLVSISGSALLAGFYLRSAALVFLTAQLLVSGSFTKLFSQRKLGLLIMVGVFGFLLDLFANLGYANGSLSTGTALLKTDVLMVNLVSIILYKKRLFLSDWLGTLIMLTGVLLVLEINFEAMTLNVTDLFFILSAMCVTANAFIVKTAQDKHHIDSDMISYYNNFVVLLLFLTASIGHGDIAAMNFEMGGLFWSLVALGGLAQTGIYFFYYRNLKKHEVWVVKLYLLFMPVLSCFIGVIFFNETITLQKAVGILVVLAGAAVILLRSRINRLGTLTLS